MESVLTARGRDNFRAFEKLRSTGGHRYSYPGIARLAVDVIDLTGDDDTAQSSAPVPQPKRRKRTTSAQAPHAAQTSHSVQNLKFRRISTPHASATKLEKLDYRSQVSHVGASQSRNAQPLSTPKIVEDEHNDLNCACCFDELD